MSSEQERIRQVPDVLTYKRGTWRADIQDRYLTCWHTRQVPDVLTYKGGTWRADIQGRYLTCWHTREVPDVLTYKTGTWRADIQERYLTCWHKRQVPDVLTYKRGTWRADIQDRYLTCWHTRQVPDALTYKGGTWRADIQDRYLTCWYFKYLISNFCRVLNVVFFLFGDCPASEFICRRFGTLCSIFIGGVRRKNNWVSDWLKLFSSQTFPVQIPQQPHPVYSSYLHRLWRWNRVFRNAGI